MTGQVTTRGRHLHQTDRAPIMRPRILSLLTAANRAPLCIGPGASITEAITLMLQHNCLAKVRPLSQRASEKAELSKRAACLRAPATARWIVARPSRPRATGKMPVLRDGWIVRRLSTPPCLCGLAPGQNVGSPTVPGRGRWGWRDG